MVPTPEPSPTPEPTPTPVPPDPKEIARAKVDEGRRLLEEATPAYKEVADAMKALPEDAAALEALLARAETAAPPHRSAQSP